MGILFKDLKIGETYKATINKITFNALLVAITEAGVLIVVAEPETLDNDEVQRFAKLSLDQLEDAAENDFSDFKITDNIVTYFYDDEKNIISTEYHYEIVFENL
jgi:pyocin large subunit-like protein